MAGTTRAGAVRGAPLSVQADAPRAGGGGLDEAEGHVLAGSGEGADDLAPRCQP
jgi:hypothetical protein